jgi:CheY-like chemotaxis protein
MRVLVVDDNATNRRILEDALRGWEMIPTLVGSGTEALAALEQAQMTGTPFSMVLLDYQMPEMDGFQLAERIKQHPDFAPTVVMMLTSAGQRGDGRRCRELGVAVYLTKPVRQSLLLEALLEVTARTRANEPISQLITRHTLPQPQQGLRVLLAEDNKVNQLVALRVLEKQGHRVILANDGREALLAFEDNELDVILLDVQMPEIDGLEAATEIRRREAGNGKRIPIIGLTAHAMAEDRRACLAAGMDAYLAKPFQPRELIEIIASVVDGRAERAVPA